MASALVFDLKRCLIITIIGLSLGWVFGHTVIGLAVALAVLLVHQMYSSWLLYRWLHERDAALPHGRGMLGDIENHLSRAQRQARKRKKRLAKVVSRFQQAVEANPDGAMIIDGDGRIEWLNKAAARMLGLRQGKDHGQLVATALRKPEFSTWFDARESEEPFEMDSPTASAPRVLLRAIPYGNSKRMVVVRDITRLHQLEQMRRDFVANVSHELRSPLTVLVGYLESMGDDERLPEAFQRPVEQMTAQVARMTRIVEDLLRLSRIESDPDAAVHVPINMTELVNSMLRDAQRISTVEHVVEHNVQSALFLLGDYNEVYSALSNLLFNAVQYTPAGGSIALNWLADANGARFEVRDSGEGIEAHHVPRLTERFYRVDKARSRAVGGTGLGLAIVKHVLMRHDARLLISSEVGKGSVFSCVFPSSRVRVIPQEPVDASLEQFGALDNESVAEDGAQRAEAH